MTVFSFSQPTMAATARHFLLHRLRLRGFQGFSVAAPQGHRLWCSATPSPEEATSNPSCGTQTGSPNSEVDDLEWRKKEEKIARDVEPIVSLTMQILYSSRYYQIIKSITLICTAISRFFNYPRPIFKTFIITIIIKIASLCCCVGCREMTKFCLFARYMNGEILTMEDERAVVENILIYHPDYEDKIGSGLNSIMVSEVNNVHD